MIYAKKGEQTIVDGELPVVLSQLTYLIELVYAYMKESVDEEFARKTVRKMCEIAMMTDAQFEEECKRAKLSKVQLS